MWIELLFKQAVSPIMDTNTMMKTFAIRRTALILNSRGVAVFPGGMGTINELLVVIWCSAHMMPMKNSNQFGPWPRGHSLLREGMSSEEVSLQYQIFV